MGEIDKYNQGIEFNKNEIFFDMEDYENKYVILCRLPGAVKNEISIKYDNEKLKISTYVRKVVENSGPNYFMSMSQSSYVSNEFYIPNCNIRGIKGNFDGLTLTIDVPKEIESYVKESEYINIIDVEDFTDI